MNEEDRRALYAVLEEMGLDPFYHHKITEDELFVCVLIYGGRIGLEDVLYVAAGDDGVGLLGRYNQNGFRDEVTKATSVGAMVQVFVSMIRNYEEYIGRMQAGLYT